MTHFSARASAGQPGPWPGSGQTWWQARRGAGGGGHGAVACHFPSGILSQWPESKGQGRAGLPLPRTLANTAQKLDDSGQISSASATQAPAGPTQSLGEGFESGDFDGGRGEEDRGI